MPTHKPTPTFAGTDCEPDDGFDEDFLSVTRNPDRNPSDSGQWGIALRYLRRESERHRVRLLLRQPSQRLPLVSATYGTQAGFNAGVAAARAVSAPDSRTAGAIINQAVPAGTPNRDLVIAAITRDINARRRDPNHILTAPGAAKILERINGAASALAIDRYGKTPDRDGKTASYHIEYPEHLQVLGVSFNTLLGASGWALQGEYSFHPDAPLQRTETSLFTDGLKPLLCTLDPSRPECGGKRPSQEELRATLGNRLQGYVERDVSQLQVTATKVFGPVARADGGAFITEVAVMRVHDMPDKTVTPLDTNGVGTINDVEQKADATVLRLPRGGAARLQQRDRCGAALAVRAVPA